MGVEARLREHERDRAAVAHAEDRRRGPTAIGQLEPSATLLGHSQLASEGNVPHIESSRASKPRPSQMR